MSVELIISLPSCLSNWFLLEFGLVTEFKATIFFMIEYEIKQRINVFYPSCQLWALSVLKLSILKLAGDWQRTSGRELNARLCIIEFTH